MNFKELKMQVCPCGSHSFHENHQEQVDAPTERYGMRWTTRAERLADPGLKLSTFSQLMWLTDPDWNTCSDCGSDVSGEIREAAYKECFGDKKWNEIPWFEEIGPCFVNLAAIDRINCVN